MLEEAGFIEICFHCKYPVKVHDEVISTESSEL